MCNMLLTGFDAPIEQTMYFDSPLKNHNLLQAIARTNRPYQDKITGIKKEFGRIVDYIGVFNNLDEALNYDPQDIGDFPNVDDLAKQFPEKLAKAMDFFSAIILENSYECSIEILRKLTHIDHLDFEKKFKEVVQLYEAISPHPILIEHRNQYKWLLTIYEIYLKEFKRVDFDAEFYAAKTRKLIHDSSKLLEFGGHLPEIQIDEKYLQRLKNSKLTSDDKAEKIIRDIETVIRRNELDNPIYEDFASKLQKIIQKKEKESQSIEQILMELEELYSELDQVASLPQREGFPDRASFDVFIEIKNRKLEIDLTLVKDFAKTLCSQIKNDTYSGWQNYEREIKRIKTDVKILLTSDEYRRLDLVEDEELLDKIVGRLVQHYAWT